MHKVAILVLADTETHGDLGRLVNALEVAKEFLDHGDEVKIVFDGAGTKWVPALEDTDHKRHALWLSVKGSVAGACSYCSVAFGARDGVEAAGVELLSEFHDHPSVRSLVVQGYQVLTF